MIFTTSYVKIVDNSGGKLLKVIRVLHKGGYGKVGKIGDILLGSIRLLRNRNRVLSKVQKGDLVYALLIKTRKSIFRKNGSSLKFFNNSVVLLNKQNMPIGTRIFSVLPKEIRLKKFIKVLSLSPGFV